MSPRGLALAFGTAKLTGTLEQVFERVTGMGVQPYLKSTVDALVAVALSSAYGGSWRDRLELASTIAGGATLLHEVERVLHTRGDANQGVLLQHAARAGVSGASRPGQRVPAL